MIPGRMGMMPMSATENNPLGLSWHDSAWIPMLNPGNIMDYFSERSNPFFDRTCNNEVVKMQKLGLDQLQNMTGLEYILLHVQEPILYVIRKQHRHSPTHVTPLADYYIMAGVVYQAPDLGSVLNSRLLSTVHHLQTSFEETMGYSRYHPSKGYWWDFKQNKLDRTFNMNQQGNNQTSQSSKQVATTPKEEPTTLFQCQRVDMLLAELVKKFPIPAVQQTVNNQANGVNVKIENNPDKRTEVKQEPNSVANIQIKQEPGEGTPTPNELPNGNVTPHMDIKTENMKPPPERKPRL